MSRSALRSSWLLYLCVWLAFAAGGLAFLRSHQARLRAEAENDLSAVASLKVGQIVAWRAERLADAAVLMDHPGLSAICARAMDSRATPAGRQDALERLQRHFQSLIAHYGYSDVLLCDAGGAVLSRQGSTEVHPEVQASISTAIEGRRPLISDLHAGPPPDRPHLGVVSPIYADEALQRPLGAIVLIVDAGKFLYPLIRDWPLPSRSAESLLIQRDGDQVLFLNELRHQGGTALKLRIPLTETHVPAVQAVLGRTGVLDGPDYRGVEVLSVLLPVPDSPWYLIAKVDRAEAFAALYRETGLGIVLFVGLGGLLGALLLLRTQRQRTDLLKEALEAESRRLVAERRHGATLRCIGDGVVVTDSAGRVELINSVAERLTGWSAAEVVGRPVQEIFHIVNEDTRRPVDNPVDRVLAEGVVVGLANHTLLVSRDGRERPIADSGAPVKGDKGEITGAVLVFRDQTEERKLLTSLVESEARFRAVFQQAAVGVALVGLDGRWLQVNDRLCSIVGYLESELLERSFQDITHPEDLGNDLAHFEDLLAGRIDTYSMDKRYLRKDGSAVWVRLTVALVRETDGAPKHFVSVIDEQTERVVAEEALVESEQRYRVLADNTLNLIWMLTPELVFAYANPAVESLLGRAPDEVVGTGLDEHCDAEAFAAMRREFDGEVARGEDGEGVVFETLLRRADGSTVPVEFHGRALFDGQGRLEKLQGTALDLTRRKAMEAEGVRLRLAIEQSAEAIVITDADANIQYANPAFERVTGWGRDEAIGRNPRILKSGRMDAAFYQRMWGTLLAGQVWQGRMTNKRRNGEEFIEEATITPVKDEAGRIVNFVSVKRDVTQEASLEAQLRQAQKMEAVGRLAGGVAHDFNNVLQAIFGYGDLLKDLVDGQAEAAECVEEVVHAADRAAGLTRQLLAFSRKQTIQPRVIDLDDAVAGMLKLLRRLIGEDVELLWKPQGELPPVKMDPEQLNQILANLVVNARDAIAGVGRITIGTAFVVLDQAYCDAHAGFQPGSYDVLAVSDDGCGMDAATREKVFEPFFTTKGEGRGTGLGLSTVYGIVKQNEGFVNVYSEPGEGSTFRVYLRSQSSKEGLEPIEECPSGLLRGTETLLVAEDETPLLNLTRRMLESLGYTVLAAGSPLRALELAIDPGVTIDLLLTDVVMPDMNGRQLMERLTSVRPGLRCLYMSGYTSDAIAHRGVLDHGMNFISKPFSREDLSRKLRDVLDA